MFSKTCSECLEEKPFEGFHKFKRGKFGLNSKCKSCRKEEKKKYYLGNKEARDEYSKKHREENKDYYIEYWKNHNSCRKDYFSSWKKKNKEKINHRNAKRRAYKNFSTPAWLTSQHLKEIEQLYWLAKECEMLTGDKYHVDHVIPLKNKNVCGLHVPWNLQVLPADINLKKGNQL